jgi:hypothetical protein
MTSSGIISPTGIREKHVKGLQSKSVSTTIRQSLPAEAYFSPETYELERRAIFSQRWFLICHEARVRKVGDYVQFEMAGYNFVILRSKDGEVIAFHNMCRQVGFPFTLYRCD